MTLNLRGGKVTGCLCWTQAEDNSFIGQSMNKRPLWHDEVTRWHEGDLTGGKGIMVAEAVTF